jgi:hypothetical protein
MGQGKYTINCKISLKMFGIIAKKNPQTQIIFNQNKNSWDILKPPNDFNR